MNQIAPFHATILVGAAELQKKKALEIAQSLVCTASDGQRPCGVCRDCRKVQEKIHPDVISAEQFMDEKDIGGEIKIDPIRALRKDVFIRPNESKRKVYVIDNAQNLNLNAQNALLKILEEGPSYAAFLLLCDRAGALLETIRSRCAVIRVGEEESKAAGDSHAAAFLSLLTKGSEYDWVVFAAKFEGEKPDRNSLERFLESLEESINDAVIGSVTGHFSDPEISGKLAGVRSRKQLLEWAEIVREGKAMLPYHVAAGHLLGWLITSLV